MTIKIKLTRNTGGHTKGDTINVSAGAAQHLTGQGYAEEVKPEPKAPRKKADTPGGDSSPRS